MLNNMTKHFILTLITCSGLVLLSGCAGVGKSKPSSAVYDFGLDAFSAELSSLVMIDEISNLDALNNNRIRYRLNYENPSRVYTYAESRWVSPPAQLFAQKLKSLAGTPSLLGCHLKLQLVTFDHVFDSTKDSAGLAQVDAVLVDKKTRKVVATQAFQSRIKTNLPEAKGGVEALTQAANDVLKQTIVWSNKQATEASICH